MGHLEVSTTGGLNGKEQNDWDDALSILIAGGTLIVTVLNNHGKEPVCGLEACGSGGQPARRPL